MTRWAVIKEIVGPVLADRILELFGKQRITLPMYGKSATAIYKRNPHYKKLSHRRIARKFNISIRHAKRLRKIHADKIQGVTQSGLENVTCSKCHL